jgi:uncharacterized phage-associated protein
VKLVNKEFEKRKNAILYFCRTVKYPYKTKIYKLLYFFDFIHFKQVGRPVTDLEYYTFDFGPAPIQLHEEIEQNNLPKELGNCMQISEETNGTVKSNKFYKFIAIKKPNLEVFSEREKAILERVAFMFKDAKANDMTEISHLKNGPWEKTKKEKGMGKKIDFLLALDDDALISQDIAKERLDNSKEIKNLFL